MDCDKCEHEFKAKPGQTAGEKWAGPVCAFAKNDQQFQEIRKTGLCLALHCGKCRIVAIAGFDIGYAAKS